MSLSSLIIIVNNITPFWWIRRTRILRRTLTVKSRNKILIIWYVIGFVLKKHLLMMLILCQPSLYIWNTFFQSKKQEKTRMHYSLEWAITI
jgi:hypothetical protein